MHQKHTVKAEKIPDPYSRVLKWWTEKKSVFLFAFVFLALLIAFFVLFHLEFVKQNIHPVFISITASISSFVLNLLGETTQVYGTIVSSPVFSLGISIDCCAIEPIAIFIITIIAFPARIKSKLIGIAAGVIILVIINILRIVSLYYIGINFSERILNMVHLDIWQFAFIIISVALCLLWIKWSLQPSMIKSK